MQILMERWIVTKWKDGCIYKTKKLPGEEQWFTFGQLPETNILDADGKMWVTTIHTRPLKRQAA